MSSSTIAPAAVALAPRRLTPVALGRRVAAYVIDAAILWVIVVIVAAAGAAVAGPAMSGGPSTGAALAAGGIVLGIAWLVSLAWLFVYTAMQGGRGSIGQRLVKIRVSDAETGAPLGFGRAFLRNIVWGLAAAVVVGYFSVLFDSSARRQGWHDRAVNALVVSAAGVASAGTSPARATPPPRPAPPLPPYGPGATGNAGPGAAGAPAPGATGGPVAAGPRAADDADPMQALLGWLTPETPVGSPPAPRPTAEATRADGDGDARRSATAPIIAVVPGITEDPDAVRASRAAAPVAPAQPVIPPQPVVTVQPVVPAQPVIPPQPVVTVQPMVPAQPMTTVIPAPTAAVVPAPAALQPATGEVDLDETRAAPVAPPSHALVVLAWDDGIRTAVYTRTLFGRNPSREDGAVVASIRDETLSLSKTHFEIGTAPEGVYVLDRHSTNGTTLIRGGGRQLLVPDTRTTLVAGDVLEFGDRRATVGAGS